MNELIELKERFENIVQSTEQFPVNFDEAWQWVEYSTKGNALKILQSNFEENTDYSSLIINDQNVMLFPYGSLLFPVRYFPKTPHR